MVIVFVVSENKQASLKALICQLPAFLEICLWLELVSHKLFQVTQSITLFHPKVPALNLATVAAKSCLKYVTLFKWIRAKISKI